jgi:hypothetical protein
MGESQFLVGRESPALKRHIQRIFGRGVKSDRSNSLEQESQNAKLYEMAEHSR